MRVTKHIQGRGCYKCFSTHSKGEHQWLEDLGISIENGNVRITIENKTYTVDGYNKETNTIYEYYGDYFHGNPRCFKPEEINKRLNCTFDELYQSTINRENLFLKNGYSIITIWEDEYIKQKQIKNG